MKQKKLNQIIPNWYIGEGIFNALQSFDVPWQVKDISAALDLEYHGNISGDKIISPLVRKLTADDIITEEDLQKLAGVIYNLYIDNWRREFATLVLDYDPIENYNSTEIMSDDITSIEYGRGHTRTDNLEHKKTGTETNTPNITERNTPNLATSSNNSTYGFNSSSAVPTDSNSDTQTGTNTTTRTGSETMTHNVTDKDTGTVTDKDNGTDTHTRNYKLTRSGNIGVTTSQQMIQSERDLYMWNIFYHVVFPDIDRVLTLPIY